MENKTTENLFDKSFEMFIPTNEKLEITGDAQIKDIEPIKPSKCYYQFYTSGANFEDVMKDIMKDLSVWEAFHNIPNQKPIRGFTPRKFKE